MSSKPTTSTLLSVRPPLLLLIPLSLLLLLVTYFLTPSLPSLPLSAASSSSRASQQSPWDSFASSFPPGRDGRDRGGQGVGDGWWRARLEEGREGFDWPTTDSLFVFGDSLSEHSQAYHQNNLEPCGRHWMYFKWADWLNLLYRDPGRFYWSFASGGAVIDRNVISPYNDTWADFPEQIDLFEALFEANPSWSWRPEESLATVLFGNNDLKGLARQKPHREHAAAVKHLITSLTGGLTRLHALGHRNLLVLTNPPIELLPQAALPSEGGYQDRHITKAANRLLNDGLKAALKEWEAEHATTGANLMVFDLEAWYRLVLEWPEVFGVVELRRFQVSEGGVDKARGRMGFMFDDNQGHPSEAVARMIAGAVNGLLMRHSRTIHASGASESGLEA